MNTAVVEIRDDVGGDTSREEVLLDIVNATFETASMAATVGGQSFAKNVFQLHSQFRRVGVVLEELDSYNSEEKGIIDTTNAHVATCRKMVFQRQQEIAEINKKVFFFGRKRAISVAQVQLRLAEDKLDDAISGIKIAEKMATDMRQLRLENASVKESIIRLKDMVNLIVRTSKKTITDSECKLTELENEQRLLNDKLEKYATEFAEHQKHVSELKEELNTLRNQQAEFFDHGSRDAVALRGRIDVKINELGKAEGALKKVISLFGGAEERVAILRNDIPDKREMCQGIDIVISTIESCLPGQLAYLDEYIDTLRLARDREVIKQLGNVTNETNIMIARSTAKFGVVAARTTQLELEQMPEQLRLLAVVREGRALAKADFDKNNMLLLGQVKTHFGIDFKAENSETYTSQNNSEESDT